MRAVPSRISVHVFYLLFVICKKGGKVKFLVILLLLLLLLLDGWIDFLKYPFPYLVIGRQVVLTTYYNDQSTHTAISKKVLIVDSRYWNRKDLLVQS